MGKLILVSGPNDSGKSSFAESLLSRCPGPRYYIAAMVPETAENFRRIRRHRERRAGLGFRTLELPVLVGDAPVSPAAAVLLEDISNLLANRMFGNGGTAADVLPDVLALRDRCALLCAVTISGLSPAGYGGETAAYIEALNRLNRALLGAADAAVRMENRVPIPVKGEADALVKSLSHGAGHI